MIITNDTIINRNDGSSSINNFEQLYINCRKKENRIYTDEQVSTLPSIETMHPHYHEWQVRKRSAARLMNYLENKDKPVSVLEAGCGNGWLSAGLASINDSTVTSTDVNKTELEQAVRVFNKKTNLHFILGDIRKIYWGTEKFDVVIFAASIQYFPSLEEIIAAALSLLGPGGEIHILDSYIYKHGDVEIAKQRSNMYYRSIDCATMADHYFHHSIDSLEQFNYKMMYDPAAIRNKLLGRKDPFPWIRITAS